MAHDKGGNALAAVLHRAQHLGFLGPGPIEEHLDHSLVFARAADHGPRHAMDLGSGGGVPGLVLALHWPASRWSLIEAARRRAAFLREAIDALDLRGRVVVVEARAETAGHDPALRGQADLVVVRSFGPPAVVAECAAPLLEVGGLLLVAEPPGGAPERWPADALLELGLAPDGAITEPRAVQRLRQVAPCPAQYPRRTGVPAKRPLFSRPAPTSPGGGASPAG